MDNNNNTPQNADSNPQDTQQKETSNHTHQHSTKNKKALIGLLGGAVVILILVAVLVIDIGKDEDKDTSITRIVEIGGGQTADIEVSKQTLATLTEYNEWCRNVDWRMEPGRFFDITTPAYDANIPLTNQQFATYIDVLIEQYKNATPPEGLEVYHNEYKEFLTTIKERAEDMPGENAFDEAEMFNTSDILVLKNISARLTDEQKTVLVNCLGPHRFE